MIMKQRALQIYFNYLPLTNIHGHKMIKQTKRMTSHIKRNTISYKWIMIDPCENQS